MHAGMCIANYIIDIAIYCAKMQPCVHAHAWLLTYVHRSGTAVVK